MKFWHIPDDICSKNCIHNIGCAFTFQSSSDKRQVSFFNFLPALWGSKCMIRGWRLLFNALLRRFHIKKVNSQNLRDQYEELVRLMRQKFQSQMERFLFAAQTFNISELMGAYDSLLFRNQILSMGVSTLAIALQNRLQVMAATIMASPIFIIRLCGPYKN